MKNLVRLIHVAAIFCICIVSADPVVGQVRYGTPTKGYVEPPGGPDVYGIPPHMPPGYGLPGPTMGGYGMPRYGMGAPAGCGPGCNTGCPPCPRPVLDQYVRHPESQWDGGGPIESFLTQLFTRSRLRFEYIMWDIDDPGNVALGSPVSISRSPIVGGNNTSVPFEIFNANTGATLGLAVVPTLREMTLNDISGVRGNLAVPFRGGSVEVNFWGLEQSDQRSSVFGIWQSRVTDPPDPTLTRLGTLRDPNIVIPFLTNGVVSDSTSLVSRVYDDSFSTNLNTQMWGSEFNVFSEYLVPGEGFKFEPLYGFRYINVQESFGMIGRFAGGGALPVQTDRISNRMTSNIYGPQVGFRTALVHRAFVLEAIPRVTFALNNNSAHLKSNLQDLRAGGVSESTFSGTDESEVDYTTVFQVSFNARVHLSPRFSLFGGYDAMWIHRLTRPYNNIVYNSSTDDFGTPVFDLGLKSDNESLFTHGFSVGGEFVF
jgi:hypothetical protein